MPRWAIVVQVCQIFIGMSGQGFTTSEPKCTGAPSGRTLQTNEFRVAKLRAPKELGDLQKGRNALSSLERGSATFGSLAELYRGRIQSDTRLKPSSKIYRCQTIDAILRFRPEWNESGICSSLPNAVKLSPMRAQRLECLRSDITICAICLLPERSRLRYRF